MIKILKTIKTNKQDTDMGLFKSIMILPFNVVITVPAVILFFTPFAVMPFSYAATILVLVLAGFGLFLSIWTIRLFVVLGKGTPAPWEPPVKLVTAGPYAYMRHPMIAGIMLILFAEVLLFQSFGLLVWLVAFVVANLIYLPLVEEKGLEKRFGKEYLDYKAAVPPYFPKVRGFSDKK